MIYTDLIKKVYAKSYDTTCTIFSLKISYPRNFMSVQFSSDFLELPDGFSSTKKDYILKILQKYLK